MAFDAKWNAASQTLTVSGIPAGRFQYSLNGRIWNTIETDGAEIWILTPPTSWRRLFFRVAQGLPVVTVTYAPLVGATHDVNDVSSANRVTVLGAKGGSFQYSLDGGRCWITVEAPHGSGSFIVTGVGDVTAMVRANPTDEPIPVRVSVTPATSVGHQAPAQSADLATLAGRQGP